MLALYGAVDARRDARNKPGDHGTHFGAQRLAIAMRVVCGHDGTCAERRAMRKSYQWTCACVQESVDGLAAIGGNVERVVDSELPAPL